MTEREPTFEQRYLDRDMTDAELQDHPIGAIAARIVAGRWHSGQDSSLYSFASTGAINEELVEDINCELNNPELEPDDRRELQHLVDFVLRQQVDANGERGPQKNWHERTKLREDTTGMRPLPVRGGRS